MQHKKHTKITRIDYVYCKLCGSKMECTGEDLCFHSQQYPYHCTNIECDGYIIFSQYAPICHINYYDDAPPEEPNKIDQIVLNAIGGANNNIIRKDRAPIRHCSYCSTIMDKDIIKDRLSNAYHIIYECPNGCDIGANDQYLFIENKANDFIYYEEECENV